MIVWCQQMDVFLRTARSGVFNIRGMGFSIQNRWGIDGMESVRMKQSEVAFDERKQET